MHIFTLYLVLVSDTLRGKFYQIFLYTGSNYSSTISTTQQVRKIRSLCEDVISICVHEEVKENLQWGHRKPNT